jgi:hypothetical protein
MTTAARLLHASQPGVSRQIAMLEEELGFQVFERQGRALIRTTEAGEEIVGRAAAVLRELQNIRRTSSECTKNSGRTEPKMQCPGDSAEIRGARLRRGRFIGGFPRRDEVGIRHGACI